MAKVLTQLSPHQRKSIGVVSMIVGFLVVTSLAGYYFLVMLPAQQERIAAERNEKTVAAADQAHKGDITKALKGYDDLISTTNNDNEKRTLLIDKAVAALNNGLFQEALDAANEADAIQSEVTTLGLIGAAYEGKGQTQDAITAYEKAVVAGTKSGADASYYQSQITVLKGGQ